MSDLNTSYYLRVKSADKNHFSRARPLKLVLNQSTLVVINLGKAYDNVGFITNPSINDWIKANGYDVFPKGMPTKLKFLKVDDSLIFINRV